MNAPLSAKQHREYLKLEADEQRKNAAFAQEQQRKEQLHKLKLQEAAAKASQGIAHKEQNQAVKLAEGTAKVPRINRQKLGLPSMNPLANTEVLGPGQKRLPGMVPSGTDTVPAMLTPGEAVIPAPAAQDPKNKKAIKRMVNEGRKANKQNKGVLGFENGTTVVPSLAYAHYDEPGSSFMNGTTSVQYYNDGTVTAGKTGWQVSDQSLDNNNNNNNNNNTPAQWILPSEINPAFVPPPQQDVSTEEDKQSGVEVLTVPTPQMMVAQPIQEPVPQLQPQQTVVAEQQPIEVPSVPAPVTAEKPIEEKIEPKQLDYSWDIPKANVLKVPETQTNPQVASKWLQEQLPTYQDYMTQQGYPADAPVKDEKGFIDSFKNILSYSGIKEALGLNNQEIARMAVATLAGRARGYSFGHSLAWAGKNAFLESNKRAAQEDADKRAAMRNAVTMRAQDVRDKQTRENAIAIADREYRRQRFTSAENDKRAQESAIKTMSKEFGDLGAYVPSQYSAVKTEIVRRTNQAVNEARKAGNKEAEHDAWLNGFLQISQIADKRAKGTTVNAGDKEPKTHVMIDTATNTPVEVMRVPVKGGGWVNVDSKGNVIDPSTLTPITGASYVNKTVDEAVKAAVPQFLPNGKPNPTYGQTTAAINTAFATMDTFGMPVAPALKANIASQAVQKLEQANMPITPDNITKAMYAEAIKIDTSSPLLKVTSQETFGNRKYTPATIDQQINIVKQIKDISSRENIKVDDAAKRVEIQWEKTDAKTARKVVERAPLNINPAIWWYNLPQAEKDKFIKEK